MRIILLVWRLLCVIYQPWTMTCCKQRSFLPFEFITFLLPVWIIVDNSYIQPHEIVRHPRPSAPRAGWFYWNQHCRQCQPEHFTHVVLSCCRDLPLPSESSADKRLLREKKPTTQHRSKLPTHVNNTSWSPSLDRKGEAVNYENSAAISNPRFFDVTDAVSWSNVW